MFNLKNMNSYNIKKRKTDGSEKSSTVKQQKGLFVLI